jgi:RNA polymerase sigma-70 factor (sigma-E family)
VDEQTREFDDFVVGSGPALLRFAYLLTGDRGRAEDLVQEALIKAHRRWQRADPVQYPQAYVRQIVVREHIRWRRRRSSGEWIGLVPERAEHDQVGERAERDLVWRSLQALPARQRTVLVLRYYEAMTDAEIATLLGCAAGTVRSLAARAFRTLRRDPRLAPEPDAVAPGEDRR